MDNLPIPQSRIENLMNAFISRDSSRISAPQSRVEEFWYHLIEGTNSLPIPQSRIELLLKKIIENDTEQIPLAQSRAEEFLVSILTGDINKLPIPQSRSEYYLDYIARNNLVLDDIEYLKYNGTNITATNTVQKPFKSAILKGNTLVNLINNSNEEKEVGRTASTSAKYKYVYPLTNSKEYTIQFEIIDFNASSPISFSINNGLSGIDGLTIDKNGIYKIKTQLTTENATELWFFWTNTDWYDGNTAKVKNVVVLDGDYTNVDIPYFEGMQSVKLPVVTTVGKNLFNKGNMLINCALDPDTGEIIENWANFNTSDFIKVEKNRPIFIPSTGSSRKALYDINKNYVKNVSFPGDKVFVADVDGYIRTTMTNIDYDSFQIEYGTQATSYEPYKSNILTVNEDVTLRGIGDVQDTLDCLTGEVKTKYGKMVIDGREEFIWGHSWTNAGTAYPLDNPTILDNYNFKKGGNLICEQIQILDNHHYEDKIGIRSNVDRGIVLVVPNELTGGKNNVAGLRAWLNENPITIVYELNQQSIKTVDLKVVDQDGNPVNQLSAFDSTTHIISDSESDNSLIAIAEVEVPTKLIEALNAVKSLSSDVEMLINEVDNAQKLQDENSTMVMSAMTELYEMVLVMGGGS